MIATGYMLDQPRRSAALKKFIDQQLLPAAIDAAAVLEKAMEGLATRAQRRPVRALGLALLSGTMVSVLTRTAYVR